MKPDISAPRNVEELGSAMEWLGEIVTSEPVGSAGDIWLQVNGIGPRHGEPPAEALCSVQLRSIAAADLDRQSYRGRQTVAISLRVPHLRYWYLLPIPTYLMLHVESANEILTLNLKRHVEQTWGSSILQLDQETATIHVSCKGARCALDLAAIFAKNNRAAWQKALATDDPVNRLWRHDYEVLWHVGTAEERNVEQTIRTVHVRAPSAEDEWEENYERVAELVESSKTKISFPYVPLFSRGSLSTNYPYLDCFAPYDYRDTNFKTELDPNLDDDMREMCGYPEDYRVRLNKLGEDLFAAVRALERIGLCRISPGKIADPAPFGRYARFTGRRPRPIVARIQSMSAPPGSSDAQPASSDAAPARSNAAPAAEPCRDDSAPRIARRPLDAQAPDVVRVLRDDGTLDPANDPGLGSDEVMALYRAMRRARLLDDRLNILVRQGRISSHFQYAGQEAAILGSAFALRERDWMFQGYREIAAALWRGMPLECYLDQMFGNANDVARGRQLVDHYTWRRGRIGSLGSPLGARITQAVGFAWAAKLRRDDAAVLVYFGDGLTSSSDFHNGLNFAGVFKAPVVFLCRNDGWAICTPTERQTASDTFAQKARAYGLPGVRVDGNDLFAVVKVTRDAIARAAQGQGPTLIETLTYRWTGITSRDDPRAYRSDAEVEPFRALDPLIRLRRHIGRTTGWTEAQDEAIDAELEGELKAAIAAAESTPAPTLASMFDDVFSEPPWHLREQRKDLLEGPRAKGHNT